MAKKINPLQLSYPTFVLGQIINPDEANQNNLDLTNKINESISGANKLTSVTDGDSGADNIGITPLKTGGSSTVQGQFEEINSDMVLLKGTELSREAAEAIRTVNENNRKTNEATRIENARIANENSVIMNEAENIRQQQELIRQQEFVSKEIIRQNIFDANKTTMQQTFNTNEVARQTNETIRIENEETREEADILRGQTVEAIEQNYAPRLTTAEEQINDLEEQLEDGTAGIDDSVVSETKVWSSAKVQEQVQLIPKGDTGKSAYEIYVDNGGILTQEQWLASHYAEKLDIVSDVSEMIDTNKRYILKVGDVGQIWENKPVEGALHTNIFNKNTALINTRLGSSGTTSASNGVVTSDFIPWDASTQPNPSLLRIKNMSFVSTGTNDQYTYVVGYDSTKTKMYHSAYIANTLILHSDENGDTYMQIGYVFDGGEIKWHLYSDIRYIRFCCTLNQTATPITVNDIVDCIATINEPIQFGGTGEIIWQYTGINTTLGDSNIRFAELENEVDALNQRVNNISVGGEAPSYVVDEANRVVKVVANRAIGKSISFLAMSDTHELLGNQNIINGNLHAGMGAKIIASKIGLDFCALLGDITWGYTATTTGNGITEITNINSYIHDAFNGKQQFRTIGNHDHLTNSVVLNGSHLNAAQMYALEGRYNANLVTDNFIAGYGYKDYEDKKVRVIMLNTADIEGKVITVNSSLYRVSPQQLQWFANSLDMSEKEDASSWGIIILSHHPLEWDVILPTANVLSAYLAGTSISITHENVAVNYDYSGKNSATVIAQFHGHLHNFKVDYIYSDRTGSMVATTVKRITIPNMCFLRNNTYDENDFPDSHGIEFGESTTYNKIAGTGQDTAFCVVTIDLDRRVIYADHYGAGYDREISY